MHIDIAFNLIRHITSPSCDQFMKGLEKELGDLIQNHGEHKDGSSGTASPSPPTSGSSSSGSSKRRTGAGEAKDRRDSQFKDPVISPRSSPCTPPISKAPSPGPFSSAPGAGGQKSGSTDTAPRHPPGTWHKPPPPEYKQVPLYGKTRDSAKEFTQEEKSVSLDMSDREKERERERIKEALADPVFQAIPLSTARERGTANSRIAQGGIKRHVTQAG